MYFRGNRTWEAKGMECEECGPDLTALRGCREVTLKCPSCGRIYDLVDYAEIMDAEFEEEIGFVPMDRI